MKARCSVEGCRFATWNETAMRDHEASEHVECSCGRVIAQANYRRHASRSDSCTPVEA